MTVEEILDVLRKKSSEERLKVVSELRGEFLHKLEKEWSVRFEAILDAIARASDLTQRGVRGVLAESVFVVQALPNALKGSDWIQIDSPPGNESFDAVVEHKETKQRVRIQVKTQRREAHKKTKVVGPKQSKGKWIVEVQKTRKGEKGGQKTRPYRFTDFDVIAVCKWASTDDWANFSYCLSKDLLPGKKDASVIYTYQPIPKDDDKTKKIEDKHWSSNLIELLERFRKEGTEHKKDDKDTLEKLFEGL